MCRLHDLWICAVVQGMNQSMNEYWIRSRALKAGKERFAIWTKDEQHRWGLAYFRRWYGYWRLLLTARLYTDYSAKFDDIHAYSS